MLTSLPAYRFFRAAAAALGLGGLALAAVAVHLLGDLPANEPELSPLLLASGALLGAIGLAGPLRVGYSGAAIPREIQQTARVSGVTLLTSGGALLVAGSGRVGVALPLLVVAACALTLAIAGMGRMSARLPRTFLLGELAAIVRSARLGGDARQSAPDREFRRWTTLGGQGVPVGRPAPDSEVITLDGEATSLGALFADGDAGAPTVLVLGSYSCPHFRRRLDELHRLLDRWSGRGVRFLAVYITEAHPEDGWAIEGQYEQDPEYTGDPADFCFLHARTLEDRRRMASWLVDKKALRLPLVLDAMGDPARRDYNAWPIRLYVIRDGRVAFCGDQGPFGFDPGPVDGVLKAMLG